jgi:transposase
VHGYAGSYDSVKRYVRHLKRALPKRAVGVMHHAPGEEGQADYFLGAPTFDPERGTYRRPWVFRMTLCHSRHGYEEAVWTLDLPTFLQLHERTFRDLGGVVGVVRHDNLTAGVSRACFYDPDSSTKYLAFSRHWGFTPLPTRPYTASENGKQERAGGYCKRNAYRKGQRFDSLAEHNRHLRQFSSLTCRGSSAAAVRSALNYGSGPRPRTRSVASGPSSLLQGVLALSKKHSRAQMLRAATHALERRQFRYVAFKGLAAQPGPPPPERVLVEQHPAIRPMEQYALEDFLMRPSPRPLAPDPPLPNPGADS